MGRYIIGRLTEIIIMIFIMSFVIYSLIGLMPGDPIDLMIAATPNLGPEDVKRLRELYGLDQPLLERYWNWLQAAMQFEFGFSRTYSQPVGSLMLPAIFNTLKLLAIVFSISVTLSVTIGVIAALKRGSIFDAVANFFAFAGISAPTFWIALVLIMTFSVWLGWLPASGMTTTDPTGNLWNDRLQYMVMPAVTLILFTTGGYTRYVRAAMIEVMRMDYIRTARAKGVAPRTLIFRHALRNALIPVVTIMAIGFGALFSGALITETMFAYRGMGKTIYDAIMGNDFNLALVTLLFVTLVTLLSNLLADAAYAWLDPRISYQ